MKIFLAFGLVFLSLASYFVGSLKFGIYQKHPIPHYFFALVGLAILFLQIRVRFSWQRLAANLGGWLLLLFFMWWTLSYSAYREPHGVKVGEIASMNGLRLTDSDGASFNLAEAVASNKATLLVFYRGYW